MLKTSSTRRVCSPRRDSGFTLVEMLVAVTLVLIMMSMFATVFVEATKSLSTQRGIAENDQRGRLLTMTIRGDLDERTFRDVLPFRANEDTRQLGNSLARRAGYFEYDEGNPSDGTDDVLSLTAFVNIRLQSKDASPFVGNATTLSSPIAPANINGNLITFNNTTVNYANLIAAGSRIWVARNPPSVPYNVPYTVTSVTNALPPPAPAPPSPPPNTYVQVSQNVAQSNPSFYLTEFEPEFDDGVFGNSIGVSALAEVCYFLRAGILYRRVLLIRDTQAGGNAQPVYSTGVPILWNGSAGNYVPANGSTFWRDFDYSAFYYPGNGAGLAPGVRFHNAAESLSNSNQSMETLANPSFMVTNLSSGTNFSSAPAFPFSLGIPHWRFGHSTSTGLPQDASTIAFFNGGQVLIGRFNLQECSYSSSSTQFGYPGYLPNDPISGAATTNPFDRQNIQVNPLNGMVNEYYAAPYYRRGQDILMSNVLTFDVKVWDALAGQFVDIGGSSLVTLPNGSKIPGPLSGGAGLWTDNGTATGNIVGGRLNSTYGASAPNTLQNTVLNGYASNSTLNHYRFDTWHPNASITTNANTAVGTGFYNEPPYYQAPPYYTNNSFPHQPYSYNEPPYVPVALNQFQSNLNATPPVYVFESAPLTAIQITINYRDVSSDLIRQVTIVQSLVDRVKSLSVSNEAAEE